MECVLLKRRFKYECLRLDREIANLCFLKECKRNGVIPKFLESRNRIVNNIFPLLKVHIEVKCLQTIVL